MSLMPADIKAKEKTIAGVLTIQELFWCGLGIVVALIVGSFFTVLFGKSIGIVIGFCFLPSGVPFAFYKPYKMHLLKYLIEKEKFKRRKKQLTKY